MTTNNYLMPKQKQVILENTYIKDSLWEDGFGSVSQIPDELDIFSKIQEKPDLFGDSSSFLGKNYYKSASEQEDLLKEMQNCYEKILIDRKAYEKKIGVLPKFEISKDEDDALVLNLADESYRIFVTIEKEIEKSFYGFVYKNEGTYCSKTERLTKENCYLFFNNLTDLLLNNA